MFGVADPADPVFPVLRELQGKHPDLDIQIINCPQELGLNPKVSTLRQLLPHADHELIVISDSDVRAKPDLLTRLAAALQQPGVGLATCLYRSGPVHTPGGALEALSISADFIPSVAMAHYVEGINFALGAVMALPRQVLESIGGFPAIADYLADDYQLGYRVSRAGLQVHLLPYVVETLGRPGNGDRLCGPSVAVGENLPGLPPQRLFCLRHYLCPALGPVVLAGQRPGLLGRPVGFGLPAGPAGRGRGVGARLFAWPAPLALLSLATGEGFDILRSMGVELFGGYGHVARQAVPGGAGWPFGNT